MQINRDSHPVLGYKCWGHIGKLFGGFLQSLTYNWAIVFLNTNWVGNVFLCKNLYTNTYSRLLTVTKNWKQSVHLLECEWINHFPFTQWDIIQNSKKDDLSGHKKTWRKLTYILLSDKSRSKKVAYYTITIMLHSGQKKTTEIVKKLCG